MPNAWDVGSARILAGLGFEALATTSSGFAATLGRLDGSVGRDEVLAHTRELVAATPLPVSADLEDGYGADEAGVAETIRLAVDTGLAGGSIEDWSGDALYPVDVAAARVAAAAEAAGDAFVLTGRAENLIHGVDDLGDTIERLRAYEAAGADVLYAPGLAGVEEIRAVCDAVSKPVNVLARPDLTRDAIAGAGARRISVGGALTWSAVGGFVAAAERMRDAGDFSGLGSPARLREWLR
jgi:2-methylisocitrate lyase-like PEP mutase family enzyme